ncbi:unnamed protein product [Notodromas monacha]|uniref:Uncharacterized protein n=1 Tax=Notodromas monacha TaxID=399045 RepID=A0A7R9C1W0_9CRUS|nr:unnamed protein product [Notodromas monacha]CAG0924565.1 unnamed protein product [Notodromas monacha]
MSGERTPRSSSPGSRVPRGASVVLGFFRVCFFLGFWVRMTRAQQSSTQSDTRGLLCYVCEPKNVADVISEPTVRMQFPKFEDIQDCAHFNSSDYYIKECPRDFSSACYKASVGQCSISVQLVPRKRLENVRVAGTGTPTREMPQGQGHSALCLPKRALQLIKHGAAKSHPPLVHPAQHILHLIFPTQNIQSSIPGTFIETYFNFCQQMDFHPQKQKQKKKSFDMITTKYCIEKGELLFLTSTPVIRKSVIFLCHSAQVSPENLIPFT